MMSQAHKNRTGHLGYFAFLASLALFWPTLACTGAKSDVAWFRALATWQAGQDPQLPSKAKSAGSFDTPIKKVTVDLGPSPQFNDHDIRSTLTCYYYPHLMVKEYAQGGSGAEWLSMLHSRGKLPECKLSHERGERVIDESEWIGYLKGVKDALVFFDANDDFDGDFPFAIYDSITGKKLFEDSAYGENVASGSSSRVRVFSTKPGYLLKYLRVSDVGCDLHSGGRACWERVKAKLALKGDDMPVCTGYEHISDLIGTDHVESKIAYPVEVTLSPHPALKNVAGPLKCWPTQ
jgi:hypothetical protein